MKRAFFQAYVEDSEAAVKLYEKAFGAKVTDPYPGDEGGYIHCELDVYGQTFAVADAKYVPDYSGNNPEAIAFYQNVQRQTGNTMQFCLHFEEAEKDKVLAIYEVLKEGSTTLFGPAAVDYSACVVDIIDKYGVRWCLMA